MMQAEAIPAAIAFISLLGVAEGIIAGKYAKDGDFPYSVVILQEGEVLCGGVLVTSQHVFTSCHCVGDFGKIEDVTEIDWEPLETGYTIDETFDDRKWSTENIPGKPDREYEDDSKEDEPNRSRRQASSISDDASTTSLPATSQQSQVDTSQQTQVYTSQQESATGTTGVTMGASENKPDDPTSWDTPQTEVLEAREGFIPFELKNILLVAGTIWIYRFGQGQVREPSSSFQHPSCNNDTTPWDFDFGVYQCERFQLNEFRKPMTLWHHDREIMRKRFNDMINDGMICTTVGWGATQKAYEAGTLSPISGGRNNSEKLKTAQVKLVTDTLCNELLCRRPYRLCKGIDFKWSDRGIVCATHISSGDSCSGDDGNALVCNDQVVGFANSGVNCFGVVPRFYTRLDYATDFYHSTVSSSSCRIRYTIIPSIISNILMMVTIKILNVYRTSAIHHL